MRLNTNFGGFVSQCSVKYSISGSVQDDGSPCLYWIANIKASSFFFHPCVVESVYAVSECMKYGVNEGRNRTP